MSSLNGGISFSENNLIANRLKDDGSKLRVRYDKLFILTSISDAGPFIQSGSSMSNINTTGLYVDSGIHYLNPGV